MCIYTHAPSNPLLHRCNPPPPRPPSPCFCKTSISWVPRDHCVSPTSPSSLHCAVRQPDPSPVSSDQYRNFRRAYRLLLLRKMPLSMPGASVAAQPLLPATQNDSEDSTESLGSFCRPKSAAVCFRSIVVLASLTLLRTRDLDVPCPCCSHTISTRATKVFSGTPEHILSSSDCCPEFSPILAPFSRQQVLPPDLGHPTRLSLAVSFSIPPFEPEGETNEIRSNVDIITCRGSALECSRRVHHADELQNLRYPARRLLHRPTVRTNASSSQEPHDAPITRLEPRATAGNPQKTATQVARRPYSLPRLSAPA